MSSYGLQLANKGDKYTYDCSTGRSIIDITLGTSRIVQSIQDWQVEDKEFFSDHKRIVFNLPGFKKPFFEPKWKLDSADWPKFRKLMADKYSSWRKPVYWTPFMVDKEAEELNKDTIESLKVTCKRTSSRTGHKEYPYYWSEEIGDLCKAAKRAKRIAQRFKGTPGYTAALES